MLQVVLELETVGPKFATLPLSHKTFSGYPVSLGIFDRINI
jgi:hypothetical protein